MNLIEALRSGKQADAGGETVIVSRQAVEEAADLLEQRAKPINTKTDDATFDEVRFHLLMIDEQDARHQAMAFRDFVPGLLDYTVTLRAQVAMLRDALSEIITQDDAHELDSRHINKGRDTLTATDSTEYRKQIEKEALERAAKNFEQVDEEMYNPLTAKTVVTLLRSWANGGDLLPTRKDRR